MLFRGNVVKKQPFNKSSHVWSNFHSGL